MKKPEGWRREPARHALASKGIETKMKKSVSQRPLALSPEARKGHVQGVSDDVKEQCADEILGRALTEAGGDEKAALTLLEDDVWLKTAVKKAAGDHSKGFLGRGSLEQELLRSLRKEGAVVEQDSNDHEERA
jgi:hypothetical protein